MRFLRNYTLIYDTRYADSILLREGDQILLLVTLKTSRKVRYAIVTHSCYFWFYIALL